MTTAGDTIEQIKARHVEHVEMGYGLICHECGDPHPCDAARLVAFTEAILGLVEKWESEARYLDDGGKYVRATAFRNVAAKITALAEQHLGAARHQGGGEGGA